MDKYYLIHISTTLQQMWTIDSSSSYCYGITSISSSILIPYMSGFLAQLSRWWVASSILDSSRFNLAPFVPPPATPFSNNEQLNYPSIDCLTTEKNANFQSPTYHPFPTYSSLNPSFTNTYNHACKPSNDECLPMHMKISPLANFNKNTSVKFPAYELRTQNGTDIRANTQQKVANGDRTQRKITDWTTHTPFIPNIDTGTDATNGISPRSQFTDHLIPYGTSLVNIDTTKIL